MNFSNLSKQKSKSATICHTTLQHSFPEQLKCLKIPQKKALKYLRLLGLTTCLEINQVASLSLWQALPMVDLTINVGSVHLSSQLGEY